MGRIFFGRQAYLNHKIWGNQFENKGEAKKEAAANPEEKKQPGNTNKPFRFSDEMYKMANAIEKGKNDFIEEMNRIKKR